MKYEHVKLVAKTPCPCVTTSPARQPISNCARCVGTGEAETELLHAGEPFFLVRGHDRLGPALVKVYEALGETAGADVAGLDELADRMRQFQADNPGLVKFAD